MFVIWCLAFGACNLLCMFGFFLIDKPKGITSFYVVTCLRKILNMRRIGFAGTLDPLATGLMIVVVGEATKLLSNMEQMDKHYDAVIRFGATSETCDSEGPILEYPNPQKVDRAQIEKVLEEHFLGERMQMPPQFSAIKVKGKRAYELARQGKKSDLKHRKVVFYEIKINNFSYPLLDCSIHCSSGTYIRSFAHDLGQILKCGGYIQELRRTKIATVSLKNAVPLDKITSSNYKEFLIKPQDFLKDWQQYEPNDDEYGNLKLGRYIPCKSKFDERPILAMYKGECVGLLELVDFKQQTHLKFLKKFNV